MAFLPREEGSLATKGFEMLLKEIIDLNKKRRDSREEEPSPRHEDVDTLIVMQRATCVADCGAYVFGQDLVGNELCSVCEGRYHIETK